MRTDNPRWWVPSTTITSAGKGIRLNLQALVAILIGVGILGWALVQFGQSQAGTGPNGSVFVTDVNGTAALAELLGERGHDVVPGLAPLTDLNGAGTLLILEPGFRAEFGPDEVRSIADWVETGGRLIIAGRPHPDLVGPLLPGDLRLGFSGQEPARIVTPIRGVEGNIETGGVYSIDSRTDMLPLAGDPPVAAALERGDGVIVYVADGSIFWNPKLTDNAAWIVSLIPSGPVVFDEVRHGFVVGTASESPTGLVAAFPKRVRNVVLLLLPVLLLALIVYGRRFGPPEATERHLAPPRRELVDAAAGLLGRVPDRTAAAELIPIRLGEVVARRAGLSGDASDESLAAAAAELGIRPDRLRTSLKATDEAAMLDAQHMLALLSGRDNR